MRNFLSFWVLPRVGYVFEREHIDRFTATAIDNSLHKNLFNLGNHAYAAPPDISDVRKRRAQMKGKCCRNLACSYWR